MAYVVGSGTLLDPFVVMSTATHCRHIVLGIKDDAHEVWVRAYDFDSVMDTPASLDTLPSKTLTAPASPTDSNWKLLPSGANEASYPVWQWAQKIGEDFNAEWLWDSIGVARFSGSYNMSQVKSFVIVTFGYATISGVVKRSRVYISQRFYINFDVDSVAVLAVEVDITESDLNISFINQGL